MMNEIAVFKINDTDCLKVLIPDFINKENYYYKPVKELHMFDIVTVKYQTNKISKKLEEDAVSEVFTVLLNELQLLLQNKQCLPDNIQAGKLGYQYNIDTNNDNDGINYSVFWLWSFQSMHSWLYNKNNKMYLELAKPYPWHYIEPEENEKVISFKEFMQGYKPLAVYELSKDTVKEWINQADSILKKMKKCK